MTTHDPRVEALPDPTPADSFGRDASPAGQRETEGYGPTAPFHDLLAGPWWDTLAPAVATALAEAAPAAGLSCRPGQEGLQVLEHCR